MSGKRQHRLYGITILYEDPDVIVIRKEAGILSQPKQNQTAPGRSVRETLTDYVRKGQARSRKCVYLVHRLDRETSGVMVVAKTEEVQHYFRDQWNEITEKTYLAQVEGCLEAEKGVFESYLIEDPKTLYVHSTTDKEHGKLARTEWQLRGDVVEIQLKSGRRNQIRVHFSEAGHPLVGDEKYGAKPHREGLHLHAWRLAFVHPHSGEHLTFETPPPAWAGQPAGADRRAAR